MAQRRGGLLQFGPTSSKLPPQVQEKSDNRRASEVESQLLTVGLQPQCVRPLVEGPGMGCPP